MSAMSIVNTGNLAEQLISGVTKMVMVRSFQLSMVRVAMIAGIAQATMPAVASTATVQTRVVSRLASALSPLSKSIRIVLWSPFSANVGTLQKLPL